MRIIRVRLYVHYNAIYSKAYHTCPVYIKVGIRIMLDREWSNNRILSLLSKGKDIISCLASTRNHLIGDLCFHFEQYF